jgi:hypothetical protein
VWQVEVTDEFADWYQTLHPEQQDRLDAAVNELAARGPSLGQPWVDTLSGSRLRNLKELRVHQDGHLRILFVSTRVAQPYCCWAATRPGTGRIGIAGQC